MKNTPLIHTLSFGTFFTLFLAGCGDAGYPPIASTPATGIAGDVCTGMADAYRALRSEMPGGCEAFLTKYPSRCEVLDPTVPSSRAAVVNSVRVKHECETATAEADYQEKLNADGTATSKLNESD